MTVSQNMSSRIIQFCSSRTYTECDYIR